MQLKFPLYLASSSQTRQRLLREAGIPFQVITHSSPEIFEQHTLSFEDTLQNIVRSKIETVALPNPVILPGRHSLGDGGSENMAYVLAADTMGVNAQGTIFAKPKDYDEAVIFLKALRGKNRCGTAFCLQKRVWHQNQWHVEKLHEEVVVAEYEFDVPDAAIPEYLNRVDYLNISGALEIQEFGAQFLKSIHGSYATILGLPIFEVRKALESI